MRRAKRKKKGHEKWFGSIAGATRLFIKQPNGFCQTLDSLGLCTISSTFDKNTYTLETMK